MGGQRTPTTRERSASGEGWDFSGVAEGNGRRNGGDRPTRQSRQLWPPSRGMLIGAGLLVGLLVAMIIYDESRSDQIREGVEVAGVDVGGLSRDQAKAKLQRRLVPRLQRDVTARAAGRRFRLTPPQAGLSVDVDEMVDDAVAESRSGLLPVRVFKDLSGSKSDANLPADVNYSQISVRRFARKVKKSVDRPPRDAAVNFETGGTAELPVVPSEDGLKVNAGSLRGSLENALGGIGNARTVKARIKVTKPKVTSDELAPKYPVVVTVDRAAFKLRLFSNLHLTKTYPIAVGQAGLETPAGLYNIQNKQVDPAWSVPDRDWAGDLAGTTVPGGAPDNPLKARWLGIADGAGIHGTADEGSLGSAASHGCIRMAVADVIELYPKVPVGAPVYIQ